MYMRLLSLNFTCPSINKFCANKTSIWFQKVTKLFSRDSVLSPLSSTDLVRVLAYVVKDWFGWSKALRALFFIFEILAKVRLGFCFDNKCLIFECQFASIPTNIECIDTYFKVYLVFSGQSRRVWIKERLIRGRVKRPALPRSKWTEKIKEY